MNRQRKKSAGIGLLLSIAAMVIASAALSNLAKTAEAVEADQNTFTVEIDTVEIEIADVATDKQPAKSSGAVSKLLRSLVPALGGGENTEPVADASKFPATHRQVALLKVSRSDESAAKSGADWTVQSFCLDRDDNLLVAVGNGQAGELQLLDPAGKRKQAWKLPVAPEAINVDSEGNLLVAGAGRILKLDSQGEILLEAESPLVAQLKQNKDEIRQQVIQQIKAQSQSYAQMCKNYQQRIDSLMAKAVRRLDRDDRAEYSLLKSRVEKLSDEDAASLSATEQNEWALRKVLLRMHEAKVEAKMAKPELQIRDVYRKQLKQFAEMAAQQGSSEPSEKQIEASLKSMIAYKSRVASISSVGGEVFVATGAAKGYGYDVWRFDAQMENPEKVVSELRGCCGQMDVQACASGLFVAENSRHQVRHFDLKGEKVNEWGGREREGVKGFGSCCNPMNVAFGPDGTVYTAESNSGRIKRYSAEGELMELIGSVELVPGCKKVSIAVTQDHKRVYMLDITRNHIIVMEAKPEAQQVVSKD